MATATTIAIWIAPLPIHVTSRSPMAMPNATPIVISIARRLRRPGARPSAMVAAMGAKKGCACPIRSCATNHATPAATAVCSVGIAPARSMATREAMDAVGSVTMAGHEHDHA